MIASVQPFGLGSPGGGPRILRALFRDAPVEVVSVCTSLTPPPATTIAREVHAPSRPQLGRLEATRARPYVDLVARSRSRGFTRRLAALLEPAEAVHVVVHDGTFACAVQAAREVRAPFFLSVHDDLEYADPAWARRRRARAFMSQAWHEAAWRFAISPELGDEYCRRFGAAPYSVVTDGLAAVPDRPRPAGDGCAVYFAGLLHLAYEPNFLALLDALEVLGQAAPPRDLSLVCRCGVLPTRSLREQATRSRRSIAISISPFASESAVESDLEGADMLYLPLPFDLKHEAFVRLSFPTKLITYLGSGVPIVYHGPPYGNAYELLSRTHAGFCVTSLDPQALAQAISADAGERTEVAANALEVARQSFLLESQRQAFWTALNVNGSAPS